MVASAMRPLLVLLASLNGGVLAQTRNEVISEYLPLGLLGEYFAPLVIPCNTSASWRALDGLLPAITRLDETIDFANAADFGKVRRRCSWNTFAPRGNLNYDCHGFPSADSAFAARWSGYLVVSQQGDYRFDVEVEGGFRLIIGHDHDCPHGVGCGTRFDVMNAGIEDLERSPTKSDIFVSQCPSCDGPTAPTNISDPRCWWSSIGCQPLKLWALEADSGGPGSVCSSGVNGKTVRKGTRWLYAGAHPIRLEYYYRGPGGEATLKLRYSGPDTDHVLVTARGPALRFPKHDGLRAQWFEAPSEISQIPATSPSNLGQLPAEFRYLWQEESVFVGGTSEMTLRPDTIVQDLPLDVAGTGSGERQDRFDWIYVFRRSVFVRWSGVLEIRGGGLYSFRLKSDDGASFLLGGRGLTQARVLVSNDGVQREIASKMRSVELSPGLHAIRLEYFYRPATVSNRSAVRKPPPTLELEYTGPDTDYMMTSTMPFWNYDFECEVRDLDEGGGLSVTRDCAGQCFDGEEINVGDRVCDEGNPMGNERLRTLHLMCDSYAFDDGDCSRIPNIHTPTPAPAIRCYSTCPSGSFKRRDCSLCENADVNDSTFGACAEDALFTSCCVAFLDNVDYWNSDCVAFGAITNCTAELAEVLERLRSAKPSLHARAARVPGETSRSALVGTLIKECDTDLCNTMPAPAPDIYTGKILESACPVTESENGIACFEGPWEVTGIRDPFEQCQEVALDVEGDPPAEDYSREASFLFRGLKVRIANILTLTASQDLNGQFAVLQRYDSRNRRWIVTIGTNDVRSISGDNLFPVEKYDRGLSLTVLLRRQEEERIKAREQTEAAYNAGTRKPINFCKNRKTIDGQPFETCCSFFYTNAQGSVECRYVGIPESTCRAYLKAFVSESSESIYTRITNAFMLDALTQGNGGCQNDVCNNPRDTCPEVVVVSPPIAIKKFPLDPTHPENLMKGAGEPADEGPPVVPIVIISLFSCGLMLVCLRIYYTSLPGPAPPLYCSAKAKVISSDTFVEPEKDFKLEASLGKDPRSSDLSGAQYGCVKPRPDALKVESKRLRDQLNWAGLTMQPSFPPGMTVGTHVSGDDAPESLRPGYDATPPPPGALFDPEPPPEPPPWQTREPTPPAPPWQSPQAPAGRPPLWRSFDGADAESPAAERPSAPAPQWPGQMPRPPPQPPPDLGLLQAISDDGCDDPVLKAARRAGFPNRPPSAGRSARSARFQREQEMGARVT